MKSLILLTYLFIMTFTVHGAGTTDEEYRIGTQGAADKYLKLGPNRWIRSNESSGKLETSDNAGAAWQESNDHTLTDVKTLQNKTLDSTNKINTPFFGENIELNDDSINSGDRNAIIDFHATDSVDFNSRIIRGLGVNGSLDINQTGSGAMKFLSGAGGGLEFYINGTSLMKSYNTGWLRISKENSVAEGGQISLEPPAAGGFNTTAFIDSNSNFFRIHDGATIFSTVSLINGAYTLNDTGGNGGNVPHGCTRRQNDNGGASVNQLQVDCAAGEHIMGGGCLNYAGAGSPIVHAGLLNTISFYCERTVATTSALIPNAICCKY